MSMSKNVLFVARAIEYVVVDDASLIKSLENDAKKYLFLEFELIGHKFKLSLAV